MKRKLMRQARETKEGQRSNGTPAHDSAHEAEHPHAHLLEMQRLYGNQAVQRMLGDNIVQRDPDAGTVDSSNATAIAVSTPPTIPNELLVSVNLQQLPDQELRQRYLLIQQTLQRLNRSTPDTPLLQSEGEAVLQELGSRVTSQSIENTLTEFNDIQVTAPAVVNNMTVPRTLTVRAAYFINTDTAKEHYKDERQTAGFTAIRQTLAKQGDISLIESGGKSYSSGRAVEVGKGTPDDVKRFVDEAIRNGTMRSFAIAEGQITAQQQLTDMKDQVLQDLVQKWIYTTGVGVDCSGFVLQSLVRAREAVRTEFRTLGVAESALPAEIGREERNAKSFTNENKVATPSELRTGDVWVMNNNQHIRILKNVQQITLDSGTPAIEFLTAESAGDSTTSTKGQVERSWTTTNLNQFGLLGTFHRM